MKKFQPVIALAVIGLLAGVIIAQFFPEVVQKVFKSGDAIKSAISSIGNAASKPFSQYRNELAIQYGLIGAGVGAVLGLIAALLKKK